MKELIIGLVLAVIIAACIIIGIPVWTHWVELIDVYWNGGVRE